MRALLLPALPTLLLAAAATSLAVRPVERKAALTSSDGVLSVQNADTGEGGTMPDYVTTLRWKDEKGSHEKKFDNESGRLGWVESAGLLRTKGGDVYVLVAEDKLATTTYELRLVAFRRANGALEEVPDFFPALDGESSRASHLAVEYQRRRGQDVFPRPLEARIDEAGGRITVAIFPEAMKGKPSPKIEKAAALQSFSLVLDGDRLIAVDLDDADRKALYPDG